MKSEHVSQSIKDAALIKAEITKETFLYLLFPFCYILSFLSVGLFVKISNLYLSVNEFGLTY